MKNLITYLFAGAMLVSVAGYADETPTAAEDVLKGAEQTATDTVDAGKKETKKAAKKSKAWKKKAKELKAPTDEAGTDSAPAPSAN